MIDEGGGVKRAIEANLLTLRERCHLILIGSRKQEGGGYGSGARVSSSYVPIVNGYPRHVEKGVTFGLFKKVF